MKLKEVEEFIDNCVMHNLTIPEELTIAIDDFDEVIPSELRKSISVEYYMQSNGKYIHIVKLEKKIHLLEKTPTRKEKVPVDQIKVEMVEVSATNVLRIGHHESQDILAIEFTDNSLFYYLDVPRSHYNEMLKCASIGSYLHRMIKGRYRYTKIK